MNSYQRLKAKYEKRNSELVADIKVLIDPKHKDYVSVGYKWKMTLLQDEIMWFGNRGEMSPQGFVGLFDKEELIDIKSNFGAYKISSNILIPAFNPSEYKTRIGATKNDVGRMVSLIHASDSIIAKAFILTSVDGVNCDIEEYFQQWEGIAKVKLITYVDNLIIYEKIT